MLAGSVRLLKQSSQAIPIFTEVSRIIDGNFGAAEVTIEVEDLAEFFAALEPNRETGGSEYEALNVAECANTGDIYIQ